MRSKLNGLEHLVSLKKSFALYHLPEDNTIHLLIQEEGLPEILSSLSELTSKEGFLISPFDVKTNLHPVVLIHPDMELNGWGAIEPYLQGLMPETTPLGFEYDLCGTRKNDTTFQEYKVRIEQFVKALHEGSFSKLVLSRTKGFSIPENFSLLDVFKKTVDKYPHMMSYVCYTPQSGLWLGSTPEIILSGEKTSWSTVALAGTIPNGRSQDKETMWDDKNKEEQNIVSEYIKDILSSYADNINISEPYTVEAGNLSHRKTDFSFVLKDSDGVGELLNALHPTPAVCGFPKKEAFEFILRNESYDRKYYSGIVGPLNIKKRTNLFVNLRCAEVTNSSITLYAGSGIMPTSDAESEWEETNHKMQTLLNIL